jgi:hypothetical protein
MAKRPKIKVTKGKAPKLPRGGAVGSMWVPVEEARDTIVPWSERMARAAELFEAIVPGQQFPGRRG